jgi:RNA polymerase sigma-70 factor (ECF subfamily)
MHIPSRPFQKLTLACTGEIEMRNRSHLEKNPSLASGGPIADNGNFLVSTDHQVTRLLFAWTNGEEGALTRLMPLLYEELRRMAESYLRSEPTGQTLQPTALVHEAYLRLVAQQLPDWQNRSHFFGVASQLMRQVLVDRARVRRADKRGGAVRKISLEDAVSFAPERSPDLLALDDALNGLAAIDPRKCRVIELRFFGGLDIEETARVLNISSATVGRELRVAKAWLYREMKKG